MVNNKKKGGLHEGRWNGLGGKLDEGESPEECVKREIEEETGLVVKNMKLKGVMTFPNNLGSGDSWIVFVYIIDKFSGKVIEDSVEGDLEWIENKKLLDLKLNPADYHFIPWLDKKKIFSAKFPVGNEDNYTVKFY